MNPFAKKSSAHLMSLFDRLPEKLRRAVADADFAYDPEWIGERIARGKLAAALARETRLRTERRMRKP
jgi:hypothetical protein